jgi:membrane protease subunit (stomatin/prohibitin family)
MAIIDRIKYDAPSDDAIVWKFPSESIRLGAQLIVNESQDAVFIKGGKAMDTFGAGTHTLSSDNIPLLSKLINLPFGGKTPFAAEVWYVNKTVKRDLKWGTKGPVQVIDPQYNFPVSVRAFGKWGMRISDARSFLVQLVGSQVSSDRQSSRKLVDDLQSISDPRMRYIGTERVEEYFAGEILQRLSDALAKYFVEKGVSVFQVSAKINELSAFLAGDIGPEFERFGIEIVNFNVERISIPEEEQKKFQEILSKRMEIEQISKAQVGQAYTTMRTFDTLEKAAENEGGGAGQMLGAGLGLGVGLGAGVPIGQQVGSAMNVQPQEGKLEEGESPDDPMAKLQKLKQMLDGGLISQEEFDQKKKQILDSM